MLRQAITATLFLAISTSVAGAQAAPAVKIKEDKPGLLAKAKISPDSAIAVAKGAVANATISEAEIENEDGKLIYSFDLKVKGKKGVEEVHVDAMTGKVIKREHESPADMKAEKQEKKAVKGKPPV